MAGAARRLGRRGAKLPPKSQRIVDRAREMRAEEAAMKQAAEAEKSAIIKKRAQSRTKEQRVTKIDLSGTRARGKRSFNENVRGISKAAAADNRLTIDRFNKSMKEVRPLRKSLQRARKAEAVLGKIKRDMRGRSSAQKLKSDKKMETVVRGALEKRKIRAEQEASKLLRKDPKPESLKTKARRKRIEKKKK